MDETLTFRWLGVQGVEISCAGQVLAIDPFFTRPPVWDFLRRTRPDRRLVQRLFHLCDYILVTHSHYDHVMDVPMLAAHCRAKVFGSANTGKILDLSGIPGDQFQEIQANRHLSLGNFEIDVFSSQHKRFPMDGLLYGPLKEGLHAPLRPVDFLVDQVFGFFIRVQGVRILFCPGPALPADVLFAGVAYGRAYYRRVLALVHPKVFVPLHWDNFFRRLDKPSRELAWPGRMSLARLERLVASTEPATKFFVPKLLQPIALGVPFLDQCGQPAIKRGKGSV